MNNKKEKYDKNISTGRKPAKHLRPNDWFTVAGLCLGIIVLFTMTSCDNPTAAEKNSTASIENQLLFDAEPGEPEPGELGPGEVELVADFAPGNQPEGIALDHRGNIYVSNTRVTGLNPLTRVAQMLRIASGGVVSKIATIGPVTTGTGALGVATERRGNIYVAVDAQELDPAESPTHGVWKVEPDGTIERIPGSEEIGTPNALAFDFHGNLYVTDSETGAIWRFPRDGRPGEFGPGEIWVQDVLLAPLPPGTPGDILPTNQVGANGIAYHLRKGLYVANTEKGLVARVPIRFDGSAGEVELIAQSPLLLSIDGITVDVSGNIYAAIPAARILQLRGIPTHSIMLIEPASGTILAVTTADEKFDFPTSLAFNAGRRTSTPFGLFVANAAFPIARDALGPPDPKVVVVGTSTDGP